MPELTWIGKGAVVRHHAEVPFRLLEEVKELSCPPAEGDTENLIVQGDNLVALKALLPRYAGQVKCIYIDPPYNTGNEGWVYNDAVNSPEIRQWLGAAVGKEAEDLSRHDKWLCMMYPRLVLLRQFLREDGAIFISIDDNEVATLRLLMDEIFGGQNFVAELIWKSRQHLDSRSKTGISLDHEYVLVYSRTPGKLRFRGKDRDTSKYANPDNDPRGSWMSRSILGLATAEQRPNLHYDLVDPKTGQSYPCAKSTGWRYSRDTMAKLIAEGRILFPKKPTGRPREKLFQANLQTEFTGFPSIIDGVFTDEGTLAIREILGEQVFSFPKAPSFVISLLQQATNPGDLILDSFAGSGTTGHATLAQNKQDGGNRRFILVEIDAKIASDITAERVRRVAAGYTNAKGEAVPGLGGGFAFARLGKPLCDETGAIRADVKFAELAEFVFFKETGRPLPGRGGSPSRPKARMPDESPASSLRSPGRLGEASLPTPLLGTHDGRAVYLLFNGILGDRSVNGGNVLTGLVISHLSPHDGPKVIYAAACRLGRARLEAEQITFKQTPYDLQIP